MNDLELNLYLKYPALHRANKQKTEFRGIIEHGVVRIFIFLTIVALFFFHIGEIYVCYVSRSQLSIGKECQF